MGEGGGVHHHGDAPVRGLVHPMHHLRFVIGLAHIDVKAIFDPHWVQSRRSSSRSCEPYTSGWRTPSRPRFGPLTTMTLIGCDFVAIVPQFVAVDCSPL